MLYLIAIAFCTVQESEKGFCFESTTLQVFVGWTVSTISGHVSVWELLPLHNRVAVAIYTSPTEKSQVAPYNRLFAKTNWEQPYSPKEQSLQSVSVVWYAEALKYLYSELSISIPPFPKKPPSFPPPSCFKLCWVWLVHGHPASMGGLGVWTGISQLLLWHCNY